jgi:hypothetical protein
VNKYETCRVKICSSATGESMLSVLDGASSYYDELLTCKLLRLGFLTKACNSRIYVITLYSGHVCIVLCVNVSMLTPRMNTG